MKRTVLRIAIFGFLFIGLGVLGVSSETQAQSLTKADVFEIPTGNFFAPTEAKIRLDGEITTLKYTMANLVEGTPEYRAVWLRYTFFNGVLNFIVNGKTVPEAIVESLKEMDRDEYALPKGTLQSYRTAAINLLKL